MNHDENPNAAPLQQTDVERIRILGRLIRQKRVDERLTLGRAAEQSGVSTATLSRLERQAELKTKSTKGSITPDTRTVTALVRWVGVSLDNIIEGATLNAITIVPRMVEGEVVVEGEIIGATTPEIVHAYLRADRNLSPQAAANLAEMFQLAYRQYSQMSEQRQTVELAPTKDNGDESSNHEENSNGESVRNNEKHVQESTERLETDARVHAAH